MKQAKRFVLSALLAPTAVLPALSATVAERVAADFGPAERRQALVHYSVPAISGVQRLPDAYPEDGHPAGTVTIVMAKDEYEPGSFLLWANRDVRDVKLEVSPFKNEKGDVLPPVAFDLKVVKVWYQNRNAWFSYFGDTGFKLVPELLLNDENLIRVDTARKANYARVREVKDYTLASVGQKGGKFHEVWLNPPRELNRAFWDGRGGDAFACMRPGFEDADTLQPVSFRKGAFKQFFLTVHATKDTPAGLYRGEVALCSGREAGDGKREVIARVPVTLRVLDFVLPKPMCYFDDNKPLLITFYTYEGFWNIMSQNGGDLELTKMQKNAVLRNHVAHGQNLNWSGDCTSAEGMDTQKMADAAGYSQDVVFGGAPHGWLFGSDTELDTRVGRAMAAARKAVGNRDIYSGYGDEPPARWLVSQRENIARLKRHGLKLVLAGSDNVYRKAGYLFDWHNIAKTPEDDSSTRLWNQFGTSPYVAWYASQHVGVEDPDFNRRQNGLAPYLSNYSCLDNYAHHFGSYNDDSEGYKPMVFTYGQAKGCLDTLQWEGFREGIDDIRYATLLVKLARAATKPGTSQPRQFAGNKALQFLAEFRKDSDDLAACRLEMINHIQKLALLNGK